MFLLKLTSAAEKDIDQAIEWYNVRKENLGNEFLEELRENLEMVRSNPKLFPVKYFPYHEFPLKRFPYVVAYIVRKQTIIIKSVMAAKMHPAKKYRK